MLELLLPQAQRVRVNSRARISASDFFMVMTSELQYFLLNIDEIVHQKFHIFVYIFAKF
jgi:hypothetical protein